jgi:hypothetical protein
MRYWEDVELINVLSQVQRKDPMLLLTGRRLGDLAAGRPQDLFFFFYLFYLGELVYGSMQK